MKTIIICGLSYDVHSPSLFVSSVDPIKIGYNGRGWVIFVEDEWHPREFKTKEEAGQLITETFMNAWSIMNQS